MGFKHGNRPSARSLAAWLLHQLGVAHHRCDCCVPMPASVTHFHSPQKRVRTASTAGPTIRKAVPDVAEQ